MPDLRLDARSPLAGLAYPDPHDAAVAEPTVFIEERAGLALATVMARSRTMYALARRVQDAFDIALPREPRRRNSGGVSFVWAGPGHWLAVAESTQGHAWVARLRAALADLASISDQTHGRLVIRIRGANARNTLAKGLPIDLHPRAFQPGHTAVTVIGHIGVHLWQIDDEPGYELAIPSSYARSFWRWIAASAAQCDHDPFRRAQP